MNLIKHDYTQPLIFLAITILAPLVYISQVQALEASLRGIKPNGEQVPIALSNRPIVLDETIAQFMARGISEELSTRWTEATEKKAQKWSAYFNDATFQNIQLQERDGGVYDYLIDNKINKFIVNTVTPVVLHKKTTANGDKIYIVQGEFMRTFRSRSRQNSKRYMVTTSILAKTNPSNGRPLEIVEYWAPGL